MSTDVLRAKGPHNQWPASSFLSGLTTVPGEHVHARFILSSANTQVPREHGQTSDSRNFPVRVTSSDALKTPEGRAGDGQKQKPERFQGGYFAKAEESSHQVPSAPHFAKYVPAAVPDGFVLPSTIVPRTEGVFFRDVISYNGHVLHIAAGLVVHGHPGELGRLLPHAGFLDTVVQFAQHVSGLCGAGSYDVQVIREGHARGTSTPSLRAMPMKAAPSLVRIRGVP